MSNFTEWMYANLDTCEVTLFVICIALFISSNIIFLACAFKYLTTKS